MSNERLRTAMYRAKVSVDTLSDRVGVDRKTVLRWLAGREPQPRLRWAVADLLGTEAHYLWPATGRNGQRAWADLVAAYAYRAQLTPTLWWELLTHADRQLDLFGYTLFFLHEQHPGLVDLLRAKGTAGCAVRILVGDPDCPQVAAREEEERIGVTLGARIRTSLQYFADLADAVGVEVRLQDVPLYNSVYRFDEQMLVTPHLYGTPGSHAPLLHLRRVEDDGLFARFAGHAEALWVISRPAELSSPMERGVDVAN